MKIASKRVLVTGGAGFIGSHLVERLAPENQVTVLDDFSVGTDDNLRQVPSPVTVLRADVRDPRVIAEAVGQAQVIFHLAAVCLRVSISDPLATHGVNDTGTLNLLSASRQSTIERFVYVSSSEVYGSAAQVPIDENHPTLAETPYAASKLAGEAYAFSFFRTYGVPVTVVRPFNSYGPREHVAGPSGEVIPRFVARAIAGKPLVVFGDGMQTRDFTWVDDTVRGIVLAAECDDLVGSSVNIARGQEVSILRLARMVQTLVGSSLPVAHLQERPGDVRRQLAGVERARQLLDFTAEVSIAEGLARYVGWVKTLPNYGLSHTDHYEVRNWLLTPANA
jgi:UDP-glucose 4-epimerase